MAAFVLLRDLLAPPTTGRQGGGRSVAGRPTGAAGRGAVRSAPVAVYGVGYLLQLSILMSTLFML